jgi:hypothetical protein
MFVCNQATGCHITLDLAPGAMSSMSLVCVVCGEKILIEMPILFQSRRKLVEISVSRLNLTRRYTPHRLSVRVPQLHEFEAPGPVTAVC